MGHLDHRKWKERLIELQKDKEAKNSPRQKLEAQWQNISSSESYDQDLVPSRNNLTDTNGLPDNQTPLGLFAKFVKMGCYPPAFGS